MNSSPRPLTLKLRRGKKMIGKFPVKLLVPYIRERKLLPGDEISPDGARWLRLDKYPQLARFFRGGSVPAIRPEVLSIPNGEDAPADEIQSSLPLPRNLESTLENLADLLNDLSK